MWTCLQRCQILKQKSEWQPKDCPVRIPYYALCTHTLIHLCSDKKNHRGIGASSVFEIKCRQQKWKTAFTSVFVATCLESSICLCFLCTVGSHSHWCSATCIPTANTSFLRVCEGNVWHSHLRRIETQISVDCQESKYYNTVCIQCIWTQSCITSCQNSSTNFLLFVQLSVCLCLSLPIYLPVCLSTYLYLRISVCVCVCVCVSVCLSVCLSVYVCLPILSLTYFCYMYSNCELQNTNVP